jgi:hypothetical protein
VSRSCFTRIRRALIADYRFVSSLTTSLPSAPRHRNCNVNLNDLRWVRPDKGCEPQQAQASLAVFALDETDVMVVVVVRPDGGEQAGFVWTGVWRGSVLGLVRLGHSCRVKLVAMVMAGRGAVVSSGHGEHSVDGRGA